MKLKKYYITFERRLSVTIIAPEEISSDHIRELADDVAKDDYELNSWNPDDWTATVSRPVEMDISDEHRRYIKVPGRFGNLVETLPEGSPLLAVDMALSDGGDELVNIVDARWYCAPEEETT